MAACLSFVVSYAFAFPCGGGVCYGTQGDDWIQGINGYDEIYAQGGDDHAFGNANHFLYPDVVRGGYQADVVEGNGGYDVVYGGRGYDTARGNGGDDYNFVDGQYFGVFGNEGNDTLNGNDGYDYCKGGSGSDTTKNCEVGGP